MVVGRRRIGIREVTFKKLLCIFQMHKTKCFSVKCKTWLANQPTRLYCYHLTSVFTVWSIFPVWCYFTIWCKFNNYIIKRRQRVIIEGRRDEQHCVETSPTTISDTKERIKRSDQDQNGERGAEALQVCLLLQTICQKLKVHMRSCNEKH